MATFQPSVEKNNEKYQYNSMGTHHSEDPEATRGSNQDIYRNLDIFDGNKIINEHALLLPDGGNIESDNEDQYLQEEDAKRLLEYRHQNRFIILFLVALTPAGVKFFKAAQSSFQEYLMNDPRLYMSATTYSLSLSLMSLPIATLIGGLMLDYKAKKGGEQSREKAHKRRRTRNCLLDPSQQSCLGTARSPSNSAILFLGISLVGILIYGYGLEMMHSVPMGLVGSTIFGLGEGCVVVASRTFVAHAFYGSDGAFAQGVLVAMNNVAMMASKITLPWLIENEKKVRLITSHCLHNMSFDCLDDDSFAFDHDDNFAFDHNTTIENYDYSRFETEDNDNNIWVGVMACCMVQLMSLSAGIIYAWWFGCVPPPQSLQIESSEESQNPSHIKPTKKKKMAFLSSDSSVRSRVITCFEKLPTTFWIVAIGRAIFIVVFKVFTRNSNSFLMEKFGVSPVAAGRKSSFHELFALGSPVVGLLAYRSPGGIVPVLLFAAGLGSISIATLACFPPDMIQLYLPGGAVAPIIGISIAHGIFIPICMAIIPQTCSPDQTGMAFAVVEVLGSVFNLTNILFGWLRDATGNYEVPMEMLLLYSLVGMFLLWISRNHIKLKDPNEQ